MDAGETSEETETTSETLHSKGEISMTVTYMLELEAEELARLETLLRVLAAGAAVEGPLDATETAILEKVQRLMDGR